jgi:hypothetical protein
MSASGLLAASQRDLPPARIRHHHDQAMARVERLIARGQEEGEFRTDLPRSWLVATFYSLMHAAAEEVDAGRLAAADAAGVLTATILATLATPAAVGIGGGFDPPPPIRHAYKLASPLGLTIHSPLVMSLARIRSCAESM